jgi:galactokinase
MLLDIALAHRGEYEQDPVKKGAVPTKPKVVFEGAERIVAAKAQGRIHFLGNHGDSGGGLYFSAAISCGVELAVNSRKDNSLRFFAADVKERKRSSLLNLKYKREDRWANYIKAAIHVFSELGVPLKGLNFSFYGNVPQNIGLASSTALEAAAAQALRSLFNVEISNFDLSKRLFQAHKLFFGKTPVLADYLCAFEAEENHFVIIDEITGAVTKVPAPFADCKILLVDSRVPRMGVEEELEVRRNSLKKGLFKLSGRKEGASFRDYSEEDLLESLGNMPEDSRRRSLHIVQEIGRISSAKTYLRKGNIAEFARLIFQSHDGLRNLYEVSCPEIDNVSFAKICLCA